MTTGFIVTMGLLNVPCCTSSNFTLHLCVLHLLQIKTNEQCKAGEMAQGAKTLGTQA